MSKRPRRRLFHWTLRAFGVLLILLFVGSVAIYFVGQQIAHNILRTKLQELVSEQLNARLDIGDLKYHFPYSLSVGDVSLVTPAPEGGDLTLMSFKSLGITLAQFPLKKGPLVIERVDFYQPTVHLIETKSGFIGEKSLVRSDEQKKKDPKPPPKLSDVLQLRHVAFTDMRAEYDDRTVAGSQPLVWENLNASFDSQPVAGASHRFDFTANNGEAAQVVSSGTLDLDSLVLTFEKLQVTTLIRSHRSDGTLPAAVQKVIRQSGLGGKAVINVTATIPLMHTRDLVANAEIRIDNGQCFVQDFPEPIQDLNLVASGEYKNRRIKARIDHLAARTASIGASLQPLGGTFDRNSGRWLVDPIRLDATYEPVESMQKFWRQKINLALRCRLHQMEQKDQVELVFANTTITPQGLAGDLNLNGSVGYANHDLTLRPTTLTGLGGTLNFSGVADIPNRALNLTTTAEGLDLAKVNVVLDPVATKEMHGTLKGRFDMQAIGDLSGATGEGAFRITGGQFARVPVLSQIADFLRVGRGAFVANDAFGHFKMADHGLTFDRIAVSTSTLRIRGQGTIKFDNTLNLKVYADPAGNWQKDIKKTGIPIFSDVIGAVAGGTQSAIGGLSKQFTSLSVTGTIDKPKIIPAPAPLLTENLNKLFRAVE